MSRPPYVHKNLPARMRARQRGQKIYYYYDTGGKPRKEISLGTDYAIAIRKWADLEIDARPHHPQIITFRYVAERYLKEILPGKAPATQHDNLRELRQLLEFFDNPPAPLEEIEPIHIRQYLDRRQAKTRANREKALFSHIWNKAREWGYTSLPNPCAGIRGYREPGRKDIYVEDKTYHAVYAVASVPLRDAMDMAYLTGQRPADILKMLETDISDGYLVIQQGKTGKKLRISLQGELLDLINRIKERKIQYPVRSLYLIVDDAGQKLAYTTLRSHFDKAREAANVDKDRFQFRDLRAKAGTDKAESAGDIRQAQKQLGHASVTMTETYIRERKGDKITPTK